MIINAPKLDVSVAAFTHERPCDNDRLYRD